MAQGSSTGSQKGQAEYLLALGTEVPPFPEEGRFLRLSPDCSNPYPMSSSAFPTL